MEMTYDGALVMPSNFVAMNEEEMMYVDGGISKSTCKTIAISACTTLVSAIARKAVSKSLVGAAINAAGAWVAGVIDTVIIACYVHPFIATAVALGGLGCIAGTVYAVGRRRNYW